MTPKQGLIRPSLSSCPTGITLYSLNAHGTSFALNFPFLCLFNVFLFNELSIYLIVHFYLAVFLSLYGVRVCTGQGVHVVFTNVLLKLFFFCTQQINLVAR